MLSKEEAIQPQPKADDLASFDYSNLLFVYPCYYMDEISALLYLSN